MAKKLRLDCLVVEQGLTDSIDMARRLIMAGEIRTGDRVWDKAGYKIPTETKLELKRKTLKYVSRGALKLEKGLADFNINPAGQVCLDIGSSTGGFTQILILAGAKMVVAVDVGYGLLDIKLRNHPKVELHERTNFRTIDNNAFNTLFALIVTDVSFISLEAILPKATCMLKPSGKIIALIKPQFEAKKHLVPTGGIVVNPNTQIEVIEKLQFAMQEQNLFLNNITPVPLISRKKNIEFVSLWTKEQSEMTKEEISAIVNQAHLR